MRAESLMAIAEGLRREAVEAGDQAFGAIVVKDGQVIGRGPSRVIQDNDPTAHAEMTAIRDASRTLASKDLRGCTMYSTSRPCAMCEAAAYWASLDDLVYGPDLSHVGKPALGRC